MNQFNSLYGEEPNERPRDWNTQTSTAHFNCRTSSPKTSPVVSYLMGKLNSDAVDICDFEVHPSKFPVQLNLEYVPYSDTTLVKSIDDDKLVHI